jgi:hypothetical protein
VLAFPLYHPCRAHYLSVALHSSLPAQSATPQVASPSGRAPCAHPWQTLHAPTHLRTPVADPACTDTPAHTRGRPCMHRHTCARWYSAVCTAASAIIWCVRMAISAAACAAISGTASRCASSACTTERESEE